MGLSSELVISINADIKDFTTKLEQVQKQTESLNNALNNAGLIAGATFAALTAVTFKAVSEFREANKSSELLENSLRTQGIYSEELANKYKKMAKELEGVVNIDDDVIIGGQAILQRFLGQKEITKELTLQTINFARAQGKDLNEAFNLVGRTIAGEMNPLARQLAIKLEDGATATQKMVLVTAALKGQLDGVAEAMANAEGPMGKLKVSFTNLQENLGKELQPTFDAIAQGVYKFTSSIEKSETAMHSIAAFITTGLGFAGLSLAVIGAVKGFVAMEAAATTLGLTVTALTGWIGLAALALGGLIYLLSDTSAQPKTIEAATEKVKNLKEQIEDIKRRDPNGLALNDELRDLQRELKLSEKDLQAFNVEKDKALKADEFKKNADALKEKIRKEQELLKAKEDADKKTVEEAKKLTKDLVDAGKDEETKLNDIRKRRLELVDNAEKIQLEKTNLTQKEITKIEEDAAKTREMIEKDFNDKSIDAMVEADTEKIENRKKVVAELEKIERESKERMLRVSSNPFALSAELRKIDRDREAGDTDADIANRKKQATAGAVAGVANSVSNGAAGAKSFVTEAGALGLDAVGMSMGIPGLGEALKPLIGALTAGPEATKAFVKEFTDAIPDLIEGLIDALPVFIEAMAEQFPVIMDRLEKKIPDIVRSLVHEMPKVGLALVMEMPRVIMSLVENAPAIATSLINALVKEAPRFVTEMINSITGGLGGALGGGGGFLSDVGSFLGFAEGGQAFAKSVPSGFGNDTFPAKLTSGELVVDRTTASGLRDFIDRENNGGGTDMNTAILSKILSIVSSPIEVSSSVQVKEKAFADIMLQLNRNNARTS